VGAGELEATGGLEALYLQYGPAGVRLAYLMTGDREIAQDLVQEAFARVIGRLGHLRSDAPLDLYLQRTIVNLIKNGWRRRSVERAHDARARAEPFVAEIDGAVADRLAVWQAILGLPIKQRTAIVLRFYEDLAENDIARIMGCRPGTARSLVSRGMASLREELREVP